MGRYSLEFDEGKKPVKKIATYENGKLNYKVDLNSIDLFLLKDILFGYDTTQEIVEQQNLLGGDYSKETRVIITYKHDGKIKAVPVLVGNNPEVSYFAYNFTLKKQIQSAMENENKEKRGDFRLTENQKEQLLEYITKDIVWKRLVEDLFKALKDGNFVNFYKSKIDSYNYLLIEDYIRSSVYNNHLSNSERQEALDSSIYNIERMLTNYKMIRETISIIKEYEKKKNIQLLSLNKDGLVTKEIELMKNDDFYKKAILDIDTFGLHTRLYKKDVIHQDNDQAEEIFSMEELKELFPDKYQEMCDVTRRFK